MFWHLIGRMPIVRRFSPLILISMVAAIADAENFDLPLQTPSGLQAPGNLQAPGEIQSPGPIQTPGDIQAPGPIQTPAGLPGAGAIFQPQLPASDAAVHRIQATNERMEMIANSSRVLTLDQNIPRAQVNNKEILELTPLAPNEVQVFAKKPGVTQINLWNEKGQLYTVDCVVLGDARELADLIRTEFPNANIRVRPLASSVWLSGYIDRADQVSQIIALAQDYYPTVKSNIEVVSVQQILLHCKIAEVSRTKLRAFGFDFARINGNSFAVSSVSALLPGNVPLNTSTALPGATPLAGGDTMRFGVVDGGSEFFGFLEALRQEELLKILSDPTLTTVSGRAASFIVGGEFPILVPQSLGTVSIEYKEFGTQLDFVPIVMGNGNVRLEVRPRISEIDETRSITINGTTVPGLRVSQVDTGVEMKPGQTLALAGLVQTRVEGRVRGFPWLSELPYIGAPFRRVREREEEIELVILVTPELAAALDPCETPQCYPGMHTDVPNDCELFWKGYIEVPSKGPCGPGGCPAPGSGQGPCPDGAPAQGMPSQGYEVIPPGTQASGTTAGVNRNAPATGRRSPRVASTSDSAIGANNQQMAASSNNRYNQTLPQKSASAGEMKSRSNVPGFIGPVGYDVKN